MPKNGNSRVKKAFFSKERFYQILALIFVLVLCFLLILNRERVVELKGYGYLGVFLAALVSSATIVVPVPGWLIVATLGSILNPVLVGTISGIGATVGEMTGYMLGYGGRLIAKDSATYQRMMEWMKKWGSITIFVLALIPNPLFDVAGAVAGLLRFPLWKFIIFGATGRIPKHIFFAYTGAFGWEFFSHFRFLLSLV